MTDAQQGDAFHRNLESRPELLEALVEEATEYLRDRLDDEDLIYRVTLLISEAATNAMEHGNRFDPRKRITVDLSVRREGVATVVCDEGPGFQPEDVADPLLEENLLRAGGRGLFLMHALADEVAFEANGTCVRILVRR